MIFTYIILKKILCRLFSADDLRQNFFLGNFNKYLTMKPVTIYLDLPININNN